MSRDVTETLNRLRPTRDCSHKLTFRSIYNNNPKLLSVSNTLTYSLFVLTVNTTIIATADLAHSLVKFGQNNVLGTRLIAETETETRR